MKESKFKGLNKDVVSYDEFKIHCYDMEYVAYDVDCFWWWNEECFADFDYTIFTDDDGDVVIVNDEDTEISVPKKWLTL